MKVICQILRSHGSKISNFDPNLAFPDCSIEEVPYCIRGLPSNFQVTWEKKNNDLNPILCKNTRPVVAIKSLIFALLCAIYTSSHTIFPVQEAAGTKLNTNSW